MGLLSKLFGNNEIKDEAQPNPQYSYESNNFHYTVEDVFTIVGRGTVVTGKVDSGVVQVGDRVNISDRITSEVLGIELFRKHIDVAKAGDICGILLKDVSRNEIKKGDYLTK